jgi:diguanylate cyclase (GGDEF)-like protein
MRILLVEDDEILSDVLSKSLTEHRYVVDVTDNGQFGFEYALEGTYDLLLLDVGLPAMDGITLCQRLRSEGSTVPILLMTAKDAPDERIRGLDAGADDYLIKPFDLAELQARLRALLRRGEVAPSTRLEIGSLQLDPVSCQVTYDGSLLNLTPKEYSLLELFLRNPVRVFSRGQIIEHLWTFEDPPLEDSVKAHIKGLRRKLKTAGVSDLIENVYGLGYKLNPNAVAGITTTLPAGRHKGQNLDQATEAITVPQQQPGQISPAVEQTFNQALETLWAQYQGLMLERLTALRTAVAAIEANTLTEEIRQIAGKAAHKLAGILGMFNRDGGTTLARQLETILLEAPTMLQLAKVPDLVEQLGTVLNLTSAVPPSTLELPTQLLLVSAEVDLGVVLKQLTQASELGWQVVDTPLVAMTWLQRHTPELVVIDPGSDIPSTLHLLRQLADRTPAIPAVVVLSAEELSQRVQMATLGAQVLTKPLTANQIWEVASRLLLQSNEQTVTVLAVDDDPVLLRALRPLLSPWGMRLVTLDQPIQFWEVLQQTRPDLLVLDVEMPDFNGIELCQAVRSAPQWQDVPIMFLTAFTDSDTVQRIFAAGADDYVTKPLLGPELMTRITNRLERHRLLKTLSRRDTKTGLYNQPHASQRFHQWQQQQRPFALAVLMLSDLSEINLTYGHGTGYQVLQRWGAILQGQLGHQALLSYWGNGDFIVGLSDLSKAEARDQLGQVLKRLRQQIFTAPDGHRLQPAYRIGIVESPGDAQNLQQLYQIAVKTAI